MPRLIALAVLAASSLAYAQPAAPPDLSDQAIGASLGLAGGGRVTPGGLRVAGHYLYQLSDSDWFDGGAAFTFGSGDAACFRDRSNDFMCDHGLIDGFAGEVSGNVRRFFGGQSGYWPYAKVGVGVALVRFAGDDVSGLAIPIHAGAGLRIGVADRVAIAAEALIDVGFGLFNSGLGGEPQIGGSIMAGAEFGL
jgi:hypothetical protein